MAELLLSQPTAAEIHNQRQERAMQENAMERLLLIRAQAAATVMAGLVQQTYTPSVAPPYGELAGHAVRAADELLVALGMAERRA